jgi:hypothetical protein
MHLFVSGMVRVGDGERTFGSLLFTERSIFVLKSTNQDEILRGARGGLIGVLLANFRANREAQQSTPAYFDDLEIAQLDEKDRKPLVTTELLLKLPLGRALAVKNTQFGFAFNVAGQPSVAYDGWLRKEKVRRFLHDNGIQVDA